MGKSNVQQFVPLKKVGTSITPKIAGDTLDGIPIGPVTPAAGAFTTLKASTDPTDEHGVGDRGYNDNRHITKVSTTEVAFNAIAATTLYTVPAGKIFIPVMAIIRAGADAGATDVTFGRVGALTDWLGTIQLDNLDASGDQVKIETVNANPPTKSKTYAATVVFQIDVIVALGGATNYVDLFGYLIDA